MVFARSFFLVAFLFALCTASPAFSERDPGDEAVTSLDSLEIKAWKEILKPIRAELGELLTALRARDTTDEEKSLRIERFFEFLHTQCDTNCDQIIGGIRELFQRKKNLDPKDKSKLSIPSRILEALKELDAENLKTRLLEGVDSIFDSLTELSSPTFERTEFDPEGVRGWSPGSNRPVDLTNVDDIERMAQEKTASWFEQWAPKIMQLREKLAQHVTDEFRPEFYALTGPRRNQAKLTKLINRFFEEHREEIRAIFAGLEVFTLKMVEESAVVDRHLESLLAKFRATYNWDEIRESSKDTLQRALDGFKPVSPALFSWIKDFSGNLDPLAPLLATSDESDLVSQIRKAVTTGDATRIRETVHALLDLTQNLADIEEKDFLRVLGSQPGSSRQLHALANLGTDLGYLVKQGLAVKGLLATAFKVAGEIKEIAKQEYEKNGRGFMSGKETAKSFIAGAGPGEALFLKYLPQITDSIDKLGVFYVKLFQSLGGAVYTFSPIIYEKIERYQNSVTQQLSYQEVREIIFQELGDYPENIYEDFEKAPFANASIAQVHRAKIRNRNGSLRNVVVKIRKPEVERELNWNIYVNQAILDWYRRGPEPEAAAFILDLVEDQLLSLAETFKAETDLLAEAHRTNRFRRLLVWTPGVVVPKAHLRYCNHGVLTMDEIEGGKKLSFELPPSVKAKYEASRRSFFDDANMKKSSENFRMAIEVAQKDVATARAEEALASGNASSKVEVTITPDDFNEVLRPFNEVYSRLGERLGYRISARYIQLARAAAPFMGMLLRITSVKGLIERKELDLTAEENSEMKILLERRVRLIESFMAQFIDIKEIHSDQQPGNILIRPDNRVAMIDWGQTLKTRGIFWDVFRFTFAWARGDARVVAKVLLRAGSVSSEVTLSDLQKEIRAMMNEAEIEHVSRTHFIFGMLGARNAIKKAQSESLEKTQKTSVPVADTTAAPQSENRPADWTEPGDAKIETAKPKLDKGDLSKLLGGLKRFIPSPVRWIKARVLGVYAGTASACERLLVKPGSPPKRKIPKE